MIPFFNYVPTYIYGAMPSCRRPPPWLLSAGRLLLALGCLLLAAGLELLGPGSWQLAASQNRWAFIGIFDWNRLLAAELERH